MAVTYGIGQLVGAAGICRLHSVVAPGDRCCPQPPPSPRSPTNPLKASAIALVDIKLELGPLSETVTVSAEALNNITLESQAIARGVDEQQIRDLPRNSRDIQSFLLLNPNVVGSSDDDPQFLGGRTYGVSYIQDGQTSTNAIFGTVGNSAPGLDAISEMQVLSNSYSAEYGGLAGVVVTTKRGGNNFHGTAFYDFNSSGLNALTYNQKLAGAERGDPNSDTHQHRWGASFGGPLISGKTFFHASYEGSNSKAIYGGGRANVPTAAMRNGDFSGTTIVVKDPLTGQPFPGNVIPANRIDPAARNILDFFYPLPNQGTLASGMGVFQQFVPETQNRQRADLRIDHEASKNDSLFLRGGYQHRDPNAIQFEGGNALTNLGTRNTVLNTATVVAGWTRIISNTIVNEFRAGYNYDKREQRSTYNVQQVNSQLGLENLDFITPERAGFPAFTLQGGASSTRPTNITAGGINADRTVSQNSFSISDNLSWIVGGHSMKAGALWTRNSAIDGRGRGVGGGGEYRFNGSSGTGNALGDLLLGLPSRDGGSTTSRGDTDGHSNDFAVFVQDDWRVNRDLTVFLGLRYELQGAWHEKSGILGNFLPTDGGHHVVPNRVRRGPAATRCHRPRPDPDRLRHRPARHARSTPTRTTSARASASPGAWAATTRRSSAAASACSIRPSPYRAFAMPWPRTCSATASRTRARRSRRASRAERPPWIPRTTGSGASTRTSRARTSTSTT